MFFKFISFAFLCFPFFIFGQSNNVHIDLTSQSYGELKVIHQIDELSDENNMLIFPSIIPGMYEENNFGQFIYNVEVTYKDGSKLIPKQKKTNAFILKNPSGIKQIEYTAKQTHQISPLSVGIFKPAGTNFNDSSYYLLNFHAIVGYFEGLQESAYKIHVKKGDRQGIGALEVEAKNEIDIIKAETYDQLVDSPFLYTTFKENDLIEFQVNNMQVQIAVYSENEIVNAAYFADEIKTIVTEAAQNELLNSYLPNKYCFLFCFEYSNGLMQGALEHKSSSVYSFYTDTTGLVDLVSETVAHEFYHVLTPMNLTSNLISPYNFYDPKIFSGHLWLYEGVTEYLAYKNNLAAGLMNKEEFFMMLKNKDKSTLYYKKHSMLDASQNILSKKSQDYFGNYYDKGALVGFYIDYLITMESNGENNISTLLTYLLRKYGKDKPFDDALLLEELSSKFEAIRPALYACIVGKEDVPLDSLFSDLNIRIEESEDSISYNRYTYGFRGMRYLAKGKYFTTTSSRINDETGLKKIEIHEINGIPSEYCSFLDFFESNADDMVLKIKANGMIKEVTLKPELNSGAYHPTIAVLPPAGSNEMRTIQHLIKF